MYLNIDLGSLYVKVSVIDPKRNKVLQGEVIRLERNSKSIIEVLINSIIEVYSKSYDIKRVYILPNLDYIECEIIKHESIMESKYQGFMKKTINQSKKEDKKKRRLGTEYTPPKKETTLNLRGDISEFEVFHRIERRTLMYSDIYIEYINSEYLKDLNSIITRINKEIALISPIRAMVQLPFPKTNRIIVNYGHKNIVILVVEEDTIVEVIKEKVETLLNPDVDELVDKHEALLPDLDPTYMGKVSDIQELMRKYPNHELYTIGGYANYLQSSLMSTNVIEGAELIYTPLAIENIMITTALREYGEIQYNSVSMRLKNQFLSIFNVYSRASHTFIGFAGDLVIGLLICSLLWTYGVTAEKQKYDQEVKNLKTTISNYVGSGEEKGRIASLEERLEALQSGKTKNYYNIAEFLNTLASPLEIESINIEGKDIEIVAYADNVGLIKQFLSTVKARQATNEFTRFTLTEQDIKTVYRNGGKMDRVVFQGRIN